LKNGKGGEEPKKNPVGRQTPQHKINRVGPSRRPKKTLFTCWACFAVTGLGEGTRRGRGCEHGLVPAKKMPARSPIERTEKTGPFTNEG